MSFKSKSGFRDGFKPKSGPSATPNDPPEPRLFVVCGKNVEADDLEKEFSPYGEIHQVHMVGDKGKLN